MKIRMIRSLCWGLAAITVTMAVYSCRKESSASGNAGLTTTRPTQMKIYLTDDQSLVFDKVMIDLQKVEVKLEDNGVDSLGGWFNLNITPGVYDILKLRNGLDTLFATGTIPANRKLQKLRLTLGTNNSVEKNGQPFPLKIKDKNNEVIVKLDESNVDFSAPDQFMFWLDFDAGKSIKVDNSGSGNNNGFELRPQIRAFAKSKAGEIEGRVLPAAAQPVVLAINGTDTATAKPEREGEFKIVGLKAGTYTVIFDATAGNYKDTTINNVVVRNGEDTHLPVVTLKQ